MSVNNKAGRVVPNIYKAIFLLLSALAQTAVIVLPLVFFREYLVHVNVISETISLLVVFYIIKSDSNPVYKIPWIVMLMLFPVHGWIFYAIYGRAHFSKRELAYRMEHLKIKKTAMDARPNSNTLVKEKEPGIAVLTEYLYRCADAPVYNNTTTKYFSLGEDMFPVMLEELKNAKKFIFMEYFIVEQGEMFDSILAVLEEKACEGVDVRFIYDSFGSIMKAPAHIVKMMEKKGIKCIEFNSFKSVLDIRYNNRDHRKICVIDGSVSFTGGINLADEYINRKKVYGHWKDTAILVKGDAVWSLTIMFLALWNGISRKKENDDYLNFIPSSKFTYNDGYVAPYTDYPLDDESVGRNVYLNIINRASEYVYIMTPYLVPDTLLIGALENAAKSGVDVRIIMPGIPDKKIVYMLSQSYYDVLLKAGVRIYEYTPGFVHAKVFLSDDTTAVVGTINLDYRSLAHHMENAVLLYKNSAVNDIKKDFFKTMEKCNEVTIGQKKKSVLRQIFMPILRLFAPLI